MGYNTDWLLQSIGSGLIPKYYFFWGHTPRREDAVDKSCFSQWYPSSFSVNGITYATAEHWMMAKKALLFGDEISYHKILKASSPGLAKKLGREVINFDGDLWNKQAFSIVKEGNFHKFSSDDSLKAFLLKTGKTILVEASPFDPVWGIGMGQTDPSAEKPDEWKGSNWLGFALMEVRDMLQQ